MTKTSLSILTLALALVSFAERQSFERYQTVVDRQMFGPPPEGFDPTKPPSEAQSSKAAQKAAQELSKEQEKLKSAIHFSMINVTPAGEVAVGFTDKSDAKNPINYYLKVGESRNGWTVKEADPVASTMTIVKGDVEVSLTIGGDSAKGAGKTSAVSATKSNEPAAFGGSLRARRNQRRAAEDARMEAQRRQLQEQQAALEKQRQEDRQAREEEKVQREQEREEQRKQLLQIQEELKRAREEKAKENEEKSESETKEEE